MPKAANNITPEMIVEDNYCKCLDETTTHLWYDSSGKTFPTKRCDQKKFLCKYNAHKKALRTAFDADDFQFFLKKKSCWFWCLYQNSLDPEKDEDKKKAK
eukprot:2063165-Ditylum_brightwellii.AAC.1